jgi:hypothetical protein
MDVGSTPTSSALGAGEAWVPVAGHHIDWGVGDGAIRAAEAAMFCRFRSFGLGGREGTGCVTASFREQSPETDFEKAVSHIAVYLTANPPPAATE